MSKNLSNETLFWHLIKRIFYQFIGLLLGIGSLFLYFYQSIWNFLLLSIKKNVADLKIISTSLTHPVSLTLNLIFCAACLLMMPIAVLQGWAFLKPALYSHEKRTIVQYTVLWFLAFLILQLLGFFWLVPTALRIFIKFNAPIVESYVELNSLIEFALSIQQGLLILSLCPFFLHFMMLFNFISVDSLIERRGHIYVLIFIMSMLMTPPDVFLQCLMAFPMVLCYECLVYLHSSRKKVELKS